MMMIILLIAILLCFPVLLGAQNGNVGNYPDWDHQNEYLQGYEKSLFGNELTYHSPHPDVNTSLLVRSIDSKMFIQWQTQPVPEHFKENELNFIWMFGLDVNEENRRFQLMVNDTPLFTFKTPSTSRQKLWNFKNSDGSALTLRTVMIDKYDDLMGYAILKLPKSYLTPGKPLTLKVVGESAGSNAWYMTFKSPIKKDLSIKQEELLIREGEKRLQAVRFSFVHLDEAVDAVIKVGEYASKNTKLQPGYNAVRLWLPEIEKSTGYTARIRIGNDPLLTRNFFLKPVRKWQVFFVMHTHTDIGYTRPQSEILPEHLRFIDYALNFCDQTDPFPDESRFRWTCESSWAVREYLKCRPPQQVERLKRRIKEGRIEVTGLFFNFSEIISEHMLAAQLEPVRLFKEYGIPVKTAMQNDVNGAGWCLIDYFQDTGIRYMVMGEHGHRALIPFDKPTAFWWESPSNKKVMAFRADHYMTGNKMGIHTDNPEYFEKNLLEYLNNLASKEYPYNEVAIQYSGYITDNSPPALMGIRQIKSWNEKYIWPKLRSAVVGEFMDQIYEKHRHGLPAYRAAWPDWWADGFGSAARETAAARRAQAELTAVQALLTMAALKEQNIPPGTHEKITAIHDAILFYDEHTFGADESIGNPFSENTMVQWEEKAAYVWEARKKLRLLKEEAMGLIQTVLPGAETPTIAAFNTLNHRRSGLMKLYIDHELLPPGKSFALIDGSGKKIKAQPMGSRSDGTYWGIWVEKLPPFGYKIYRIVVDKKNSGSRTIPKKEVYIGPFENNYYRITVDPESGAVSSLFDKDMKQELVDQKSPWKLGRFIYEELSNRQQLEHFRLMEKPRLTTLSDVKIEGQQDGPVWKSLFINGRIPRCVDKDGVRCEIRLFHFEKRVEFHFSMRKLTVLTPESVYVAFPFAMPGAEIYFEVQGAAIRPGKDQLPRTSSDWNTIQDFTAIRSHDGQIVFGSRDILLAHFGDLNIGKFQPISKPEHPHVYSWVLNNYWVTNFKAYQEGELKWSYFITSSKENSNTFASNFARGSIVPIPGRVFPAGVRKEENRISQQFTGSLLTFDTPNVLLVSAEPAREGGGIILHLRELDGKLTIISLSDFSNNRVFELNALHEHLKTIKSTLKLGPYETKFLKIVF
jgi:alpha-mannosidase